MAGKKGRGGRPMKPLEFKKRDGTVRKNRVRENLPPVEPVEPERPALSGEVAENWWAWWVERLGPRGRNILTEVDGPALAEVCEIQAELYRRRTAEKPKATSVLTAQLRSWYGLFGLTPADRQRIPSVSSPEPGKKKLRPRGAK